MVEVVVEFDYDAEEEDELTIKKGDIIANVVRQEGGWWAGELNGKKGVFPDNFVKELTKEEQKVTRDIKKEGHGQTEIADKLQNILSKGGGPAFAPPGIQKRLNNPSKRQIRAKAAFSYAPENEDELKLEIGDVIQVLRQEEEGWWEGTVNGKSGVFPSNFVEVILEDGTIAKPEDVVIPDTGGEQEKVEVQGKKVKGVGLGNIFANGPIVLKKAGSKDEPTKMVRSRQSVVVESPAAAKLPQKSVSPVPVGGHKKPVMPAVPRELPNLPPKDMRDNSVCEKARVLFSYKAENDDELTLEEGNIVVVLEKELEDSGWWKGELNGKVGVFPDNFVQPLPKEEHPSKPKKPPPPTVSAPNGKATPPPHQSNKPGSPAFLRKAKDASGPVKKGPPPPPIGKKPQKPADSKLLSQTDDQNAKDSNQSTEDLSEFDGVESTHEKLRHPTANRVKAPQRRPPSHIRDKEDEQMSEEGEMTDMTVESGDVESSQEEMHCLDAKEEVQVTRPAPPLLVPYKKSSTLPKPAHSEPVNGAQASTPSSLDLAELKKEIENLKANTVSKENYDVLEAECKELKENIAQIKTTMNKKIYRLMTEIDEEKKTRLNMQVEIDRLKTLMTS